MDTTQGLNQGLGLWLIQVMCGWQKEGCTCAADLLVKRKAWCLVENDVIWVGCFGFCDKGWGGTIFVCSVWWQEPWGTIIEWNGWWLVGKNLGFEGEGCGLTGRYVEVLMVWCGQWKWGLWSGALGGGGVLLIDDREHKRLDCKLLDGWFSVDGKG